MFEVLRKPSEAIEALRGIHRGGLYVITLQNSKALGIRFAEEFSLRARCDLLPENAIYVGKGENLGKRLCQELLQTNRATFFRSVGALLGMKPFENQTSPTNYMFGEPQKSRIIGFIENNMLVGYEFVDSIPERKSKEIEAIFSCHPILNTQHNKGFTYSELAKKRERCRIIAARPLNWPH